MSPHRCNVKRKKQKNEIGKKTNRHDEERNESNRDEINMEERRRGKRVKR